MTPLMITQMARNAAVRSAEQARSSSAAQNQQNSEPSSSGQQAAAPVRRCLFAYFPAPVPMPQTAPSAQNARRPRSTPFGRCDSTSYAYCALAAALFLVGALMFIFMYLSAAAHGTHERPANLDDGWLVGPIFMCTGLLLGIKNLLYMRRAKLLFDLLLAQEQRANEREFHDIESCVNRNASVATLPPSYDVAVTMPLVSNQGDGVKDNDGASGSHAAVDGGLPSYDEALRLLCDNRASGAPAYNEGNTRIIIESTEGSETRRTGNE